MRNESELGKTEQSSLLGYLVANCSEVIMTRNEAIAGGIHLKTC